MLNRRISVTATVVILLITSLPLYSQNPAPKKTRADVMREIRLKVLTTAPSTMKRAATKEYPHVDTVVMDWPVQETVMTVMASSGGDGSIYTTGDFGLFGGVKYENVRNAAKNLVKVAEKYYSESFPTQSFDYPQPGHVRFYFVCYDGVRVIEADPASLSTPNGKYADLFAEAQKVITELRKINQDQSKQPEGPVPSPAK